MKYHVIFNPKSGTALTSGVTVAHLEAAFREAKLEAVIDQDVSTLEGCIKRALESKADVIVCAGGDGTITATAQAAMGASTALAVIPLGTANLLARDLAIPLDYNKAISRLREMVPTPIDVGEVNGRIFMHSATVGVIPAIAAAREKVRGAGLTALLGFGSYMFRRLNNARRTAIAITSRDTQDRVERIHAVAVANNAYDQGWGKVFTRSCLDAGTLSLYILRRLRATDLVRLGAKMLMGNWQDDEVLTVESVRSVTLGSKRPRLAVMIDGETATLETPLNFKIRPGALHVLAPAKLSHSAEPSKEPA
jgi:diacylglycerol kinase family enzyme